MPKYYASLSSKSISSLIDNVREYKKKVEKLPAKIVYEACAIGEETIADNISGVRDVDGNYLASSGRSVDSQHGAAYMEGAQAKYLEYGTGIEGEGTYPGQLAPGWEYGVGKQINPLSGIWMYKDSATGEWIQTRGIPAQAPVWNAVDKMREAVRKVKV